MLFQVDLLRRPGVERGVANAADERPLLALVRPNVGPKFVLTGKVSAANVAREAARKCGDGQLLWLGGLEVHLEWKGLGFESRLVVLKFVFLLVRTFLMTKLD